MPLVTFLHLSQLPPPSRTPVSLSPLSLSPHDPSGRAGQVDGVDGAPLSGQTQPIILLQQFLTLAEVMEKPSQAFASSTPKEELHRKGLSLNKNAKSC